MQLIFEQIRAGGDRNFGYLLADRHARQGVLIDPSYSPDVFVDRATAQGITITHIINTHSHPDHVNGNARAVELTSAPIVAHPDSAVVPDMPFDEGRALACGGLQLTCLRTPGHCADHLVLYEPTNQLLITGDLIFVGKVGGTRSEDDARTEWDSLQRVLASIPGPATLWPGHDYGIRPSSTVDLERRTNPFLLCANLDAFLALKRDWAAFKKQHGLQ